jgi:hypothetical protein
MTMDRHPVRNGPKFPIEMQPAHDDLLVIEAGGSPTRPGVPLTLVHHRDLPELRGEGLARREAAGGLLWHLTAERGCVLDGWRRELLERVIGDVEAFLERGDLDNRSSTGPEEARDNDLSSIVSVGFPLKLGSSRKYVGSMT